MAETDKQLMETIVDCIVDQLSVDKSMVKYDTSIIDDLGADPLDVVELTMCLENEFEISIPEEEAERCNTVGNYYELIKSKKEKGKCV